MEFPEMETEMIAFRLDANASVATGHMYRCISIARVLRKAGEECIFLLAQDENTNLLEKEGFQYYILNISWENWDEGVSVVKEWIVKNRPSCLVADSYKVTKNFFARLIDEVPILYLDDLCDTVYPVSAVIHYSEWPREDTLQKLYAGTDVATYAGMQYVPLREAFEKKTEDARGYELMITTGGSDTYHVTLKVLKKLLQHPFRKEQQICIVMGRMNTDAEEILRLTEPFENITVLQNISNMDEIMRQSKYAISACGTSIFELMASGVAFVCFGFSDDQVYFGERLEKFGNALWAGDAREDAEHVTDVLLEKLEELRSRSQEEIRQLTDGNRTLTDGRGASRIAQIIKDLDR